MTNRFAMSLHTIGEPGTRDQRAHAASPQAAEAHKAVVGNAQGQVHKPLKLAAILRHVMLMEHTGPAGEPTLCRVNRVLDAALEACLRLDTARQQLQSAISTQRELEVVLEMLAARVEMRQASAVDHRKVASRLTSACDTVTQAVAEWNRMGRRFTQLTRLLPAQLEAGIETMGPVLSDEMDRLAQACLSIQADVHLSLSQRAQAWAEQRARPAGEGDARPQDFGAWLLNLENARAQASADFASAREAYLQAVFEFDREHAHLVRARSQRRIAEMGFRLNTRGTPDFAEAVLEESRCNLAVLRCQSQRQATGYHLYALAGLLPMRFGLFDMAVGH